MTGVPFRRAGAAVVAGLVAATALAACGGGGSPSAGLSSVPVVTSTQTTAASSTRAATSVAISTLPASSARASSSSSVPPSSRPPTSPATSSTQALPALSLTDPASLWVIVNKHRPLAPKAYAPGDLVSAGNGQLMRRSAATAIQQMFAAARQAGLTVYSASGYRAYTTQVDVYAGAVRRLGMAQADIVSARPGYSEHQTGWTMDVAGGGCVIEDCFAGTPQGTWVAANAYRWGFVVRYPKGAQAVTGYQYEPWHLRYVGTDLAGAMHARGVSTLEQWFGLAPAPAYPGEPKALGEEAHETPGD